VDGSKIAVLFYISVRVISFQYKINGRGINGMDFLLLTVAYVILFIYVWIRQVPLEKELKSLKKWSGNTGNSKFEMRKTSVKQWEIKKYSLKILKRFLPSGN